VIYVKAPTIQVGLNYAPGDVVAGDTVYFTATADTDGTGLSYAWDFGDTTRANGLNNSHVFATDGEYTVVFTATDTCGYYSTEEAIVKVEESALVASFDQSATSVVVGDTVYFTDTSTTDRPPIVAWLWDFGDMSAKATTQDASHTYTSEGSYTVTLTVTDTLGYSDQVEGSVTVASGCISLTGASFTYQPMMPVMGSVVSFTASISPSDATGPVTYLWDFGDKSIGSGATPTHAYASAGTYKVSVTASNACTPAGVTSKVQDIEVMLHRIFLPLVVR
jgi:PKD repeat protein